MSRETRTSRGGRGLNPVAPDWQDTAGNTAPSLDDTRFDSAVDLSTLNKGELKELARARGLSISGTKQDLIDLLEE